MDRIDGRLEPPFNDIKTVLHVLKLLRAGAFYCSLV